MNATPDTRRPRNLAEEIGKRTAFESPEQEAFLNLVRTREALAADFDTLFRAHGLSHSQYNVLRIVRGHGRAGVPCQQIVAHMISREPDVTRLIDRLEAAGLVARERSIEDRRVVRVTLTPEGAALLRRLDRPLAELHRRQLGHLGPRKLRMLSRLLVEARHGELQ
jgi:DNA-binding MarR family transcriptional regulator